MDPGSTDKSQQDTWQISRQHAGTWRSWDGEIVIYDDMSGDTMKLDIIMSEIFRFMLQMPATQAEITHHLASALDLKVDEQLRHLTATALHRLHGAALIQAMPAAGPWDAR